MRKRAAWTKALLLLFTAFLILLVLADTAASSVEVEDPSKLCRTNICAENSNGLRCPNGSVIHIRNMSCSTGSDECSRSSYVTLHTLCESSQGCDASGLKALLPEYCQATEESKRNVLVNYLCIAESHVDTSCRKGGYKKLYKDLGVIRSPKLGDTGSNPAFCGWTTNLGSSGEVKVTVHLVSARMCCINCVTPSAILSVIYLDCVTGLSTSRKFCDVQQSGIQLRSCGKVIVRSSIPPGEEGLDDFVVSYEKSVSRSQTSSPAGVSSCLEPWPGSSTPRVAGGSPNVPSVAAPPRPQPRTSPVPSLIARNFGPADGMLDHKDSAPYAHDADAAESGPISKNLKLLILYISFGAIILVLLIALIAVIISYRRISKVRQSDEASGEKTALWRQDDTPLDTFQTNSSAGDSGSHISEATYSFRTNPNADQVVATIHNDGIFENDGPDHRVSTGSGISTFLSGKRDSDFKDLIKKFQTGSFDVYSSPDDNMINSFNRDGGLDNYPEDLSGNTFNDIYEVIDRSVNKTPDLHSHEEDSHLVDHQDHQPLVRNRTLPSDDLHYCINNDEYAIVRKNRKPAKPVRPSLLSEAEHLSSTPTLRSEGVVDFRPTSGPYDKQRGLGVESQGAKGKGWNYEF